MTKPPPTEPPDLAAMRATLARAWADAARYKPVIAADGRALGDPARHDRAVAQALRLTAAIEREERAGRIERQKPAPPANAPPPSAAPSWTNTVTPASSPAAPPAPPPAARHPLPASSLATC